MKKFGLKLMAVGLIGAMALSMTGCDSKSDKKSSSKKDKSDKKSNIEEVEEYSGKSLEEYYSILVDNGYADASSFPDLEEYGEEDVFKRYHGQIVGDQRESGGELTNKICVCDTDLSTRFAKMQKCDRFAQMDDSVVGMTLWSRLNTESNNTNSAGYARGYIYEFASAEDAHAFYETLSSGFYSAGTEDNEYSKSKLIYSDDNVVITAGAYWDSDLYYEGNADEINYDNDSYIYSHLYAMCIDGNKVIWVTVMASDLVNIGTILSLPSTAGYDDVYTTFGIGDDYNRLVEEQLDLLVAFGLEINK